MLSLLNLISCNVDQTYIIVYHFKKLLRYSQYAIKVVKIYADISTLYLEKMCHLLSACLNINILAIRFYP